MSAAPDTDRIYLRDAQCRAFDAAVVAVEEGGRVALDATAFYATGEVGRFEVTKTESKGKANKRLRIALSDA